MFPTFVSLLRPNHSRSRSAAHGLHILPLRSTVHADENGDYLAAWADHDGNPARAVPHRLRDAEAYDEYGRLMHSWPSGQADPELGAGRPHVVLAPGDLADLLKTWQAFPRPRRRTLHALVKR